MTKRLTVLLLAFAISLPIQAAVIPSGVQQVQGTDGVTRGNPVNVVITDGAGAAIIPAASGTSASPSTAITSVQGDIAKGITDAGNPVKTGGLAAGATPPTAVTAAQRVNTWLTLNGATVVAAPNTTAGDGNNNTVVTMVDHNGVNRQGWTAINNYNGASWDRVFTCSSTAVVAVTAGNTTEIVALSGSTQIRVCSLVISTSLAGTAQFVYGSGTNCGTGTTNITGAMNLATATPLAISSGNGSVFRALAAKALCLSAVTGNVNGFVTYAQY